MGNELFSKDKTGKKIDSHFHETILDNKEAEKEVSKTAVDRAIKEHGLTREQAETLYGYKE
jgi:hypothetical protein